MIPKKSNLNEVQNSDLYFLDLMLHNRTSPYAQIPLLNIIISYMKTAARHHITKYRFEFPHLLSLLFEQERVYMEAIVNVQVKAIYELNE